ncbi:ARS binding protein 2 [Phlyctema vagabunda]|uniref:ARS binding protein 2 n=1 Tax=Phlyctema vagabunda TaxID=108571 RepID=A0ABR4P5T5_9HELO
MPPSFVLDDATKQQLMAKYMPYQKLTPGEDQALRESQANDNSIHAPQQNGQNGFGSCLSATHQDPLGPSSLATTAAQVIGSSQDLRILPNRSVTDDTLDDAYVTFILYCNPAVPLSTDTTELRTTFRSPPKSDGKSFSTYKLYELIKKLELKELQTWAQLALELGVEPPALDKGQSAQKVQQYAVRLKRWMHAMHVDAFFEYLLSKAHVYWTHVPSIHEPPSESGRDGVAAGEDLALRALLPETKPKRGRRKAGERDDESETGRSPAQRPRLHSPTLSEDFMINRSSLDHENPTPVSTIYGNGFQDRNAPWSAADVRGPVGTAFRWGASRDSIQTPLSAYPQSAITPTNRTSHWNDQDEPRSAITPNKSRSRRRHGPAVSSAWPSNGSGSSGRLRGRPPSNRSVQDGPFSTFPANPSTKDGVSDNSSSTTPMVQNPQVPHFFPPSNPLSTRPTAPPNGKPSRLSLQVPQRQGGAVRLATPPPILLVNGTSGLNVQNGPMPHNGSVENYYNGPSNQHSDLQPFVNITFRQNDDSDRTNVDNLESHFICEILAAEWYDSAGVRIEKCTIDEASKICKQVIRNLQDESGTPEAFLMSVTALAGGPLRTHMKMTRLDESDTRTAYECHWRMRFGSIEGDFNIRATVQSSVTTAFGSAEQQDVHVPWKKRYLDLQQRIRERDEKVGALKKNILDALVESDRMMLDKRGEFYPPSDI